MVLPGQLTVIVRPDYTCADLHDTLEAYQELGYMIDTRLHHFAYGLKVAHQFS